MAKRDWKNFLHELLVWDDKQSFTFHLFSVSLAKTYSGERWSRRWTYFRNFLDEYDI